MYFLILAHMAVFSELYAGCNARSMVSPQKVPDSTLKIPMQAENVLPNSSIEKKERSLMRNPTDSDNSTRIMCLIKESAI